MKSDNPIGVDFKEPVASSIQVVQDPDLLKANKRRERLREKMSEAKAFQELGCKVIRLKNKTYSSIGKEAHSLGIKNIGHGTYVIAREFAEEAIIKLDDLIEQLQMRDPPCELAEMTDLMRLRKEYVTLLMESGKAHIKAEKQETAHAEGLNITMPFPAGTPMMVAVGKSPKSVEDTPPEG